jgi:hypothetical protein
VRSKLVATGLAALCAGALACEPFDVPGVEHGVYAACCEGIGMCLPAALIDPAQAQQLPVDACAPALLCVPLDATDPASYRPASCRTDFGGEGRCLPACLPQVTAQAAQLSQGECAAHHVCAPCFDPLSGAATGACSVAADPGPSEPPRVFATCCAGEGRCIPDALVPAAEHDRLGTETCSAAQAELCVPEPWLGDAPIVPASCRASTGGEGRCLPACLPEIAAQADRLEQGSCAGHTLCAPCFDPLSGEPTSACNVGADPGPAEAPHVFARCCEGEGRCIPDALVPDGDRDRLGADACSAAQGELCVPSPWLQDPPGVPASCRSLGGGEGRCLPACLPELAGQVDRLQQSDCPVQHLCAPCFDPLTGEATDACALASDAGPAEPPYLFARCCEGAGRCLPEALVPEAGRERLGADACDAAHGELCVPEPWLAEDAPLVPLSCRSIDDVEGRCLPACLPELAARAAELPASDCPARHLCAPCFDPLSGEPTDACTIGDDPGPTEAPRVFAPCCSGEGRCLPRTLVPEADREQLDGDDCAAGSDALCVPSPWIVDEPVVAQSCRSHGDAEGRCLLACLPTIAGQADRLPQGDCAPHHLCAPCFDPLTGDATGACTLGDDPGPAEPPRLFPGCCAALGRPLGLCIPDALLSAEDLADLPDGLCTDAGMHCVPDALARGDELASCDANVGLGTDPGACVPECLLESQATALLARATCRLGERCVPCTELGIEGAGCD